MRSTLKFIFTQKGLASSMRIAKMVIGFVLLVIAIAWISGMFEPKVQPDWQERGVRRHTTEPITEVHEVTKPYVEEAVGTLKASSRTNVAAKVLATIENVNVKAGDQVSSGQTLIVLDAKEHQARLSGQSITGSRHCDHRPGIQRGALNPAR